MKKLKRNNAWSRRAGDNSDKGRQQGRNRNGNNNNKQRGENNNNNNKTERSPRNSEPNRSVPLRRSGDPLDKEKRGGVGGPPPCGEAPAVWIPGIPAEPRSTPHRRVPIIAVTKMTRMHAKGRATEEGMRNGQPPQQTHLQGVEGSWHHPQRLILGA